MRDSVILGGRSHPELLKRICYLLDVEPAEVEATNFSNGETCVKIQNTVREKHVYVIQSACDEVNDMFMELLIMISACNSASAKSVTAVLPLFPYSRQWDVRDGSKCFPTISNSSRPRSSAFDTSSRSDSTGGPTNSSGSPFMGAADTSSPVKNENTNGCKMAQRLLEPPSMYFESASNYIHGRRKWVAQTGQLIASLLTCAGADHIITMDLHDPQFQGFFDIPVDNLYARPLFEQYILNKISNYKEAVIVSPDAGGAKRAAAIADRLKMPVALIHQDQRNNATLLVGDVSSKVAIIIDDLVDSGRTVMRAARVVKDYGATAVYAMCYHCILSGDASTRIARSAIDRMITTNSVPQQEHQRVLGDKLEVVDISGVFAEAIRRIHNGESISLLFDHEVDVL